MKKLCALAVFYFYFPLLVCAQSEFSPILGGLPAGSGLALGVEYRRPALALSGLDFRLRAIGSAKRYEHLEAGFEMPRLLGGWFFANFGMRYRNYPEEDFWGLGPASLTVRRSNFRLEDIGWQAQLGVRPLSWLQAGFDLGKTYVNVGPGRDGRWPDTLALFKSDSIAGLERQPDYRHWGVFLKADRRDDTEDPRRGGYFGFRRSRIHHPDLALYSFSRYELDLRHFASPFSQRDTIAVRAQAWFSRKSPGRRVPFYLQPSVGGGEVRGFDPTRFRDENAVALNLEYRLRVRQMLQLVGFVDSGRVFSRPGQIRLGKLRYSAGFGVRFKLGQRILAGLDLGWSPQGMHLWFRSSHLF